MLTLDQAIRVATVVTANQKANTPTLQAVHINPAEGWVEATNRYTVVRASYRQDTVTVTSPENRPFSFVPPKRTTRQQISGITVATRNEGPDSPCQSFNPVTLTYSDGSSVIVPETAGEFPNVVRLWDGKTTSPDPDGRAAQWAPERLTEVTKIATILKASPRDVVGVSFEPYGDASGQHRVAFPGYEDAITCITAPMRRH